MAFLKLILTRSTFALTLVVIGTLAQAETYKLIDPQIAHVVITANNGEIMTSQLAVGKTRNAGVIDFAKILILHHTKNNTAVVSLAKKFAVIPMTNELSALLNTQAERQIGELRGRARGEFDLAFIDQQIAAHQQVLTLIDDELLTNVTNEEMRVLLTEIRPTVAEHLKLAQALGATLGAK